MFCASRCAAREKWFVLLTLEACCDVTNLRRGKMQDRGLEILETSAQEFRSKCCSNHVAGVYRGAYCQMLITIIAEESDTLRAHIQLERNIGSRRRGRDAECLSAWNPLASSYGNRA